MYIIYIYEIYNCVLSIPVFPSQFPLHLCEDDWAAWTTFTTKVGGPTQVVGDDLTVWMPKGLRMGTGRGRGWEALGKRYNKNEVVWCFYRDMEVGEIFSFI